MTKDIITYFEKFLQSQGIPTAPPRLLSAGKATISPDEGILGALEIVRHLSRNEHLYQMPFWNYKQSGAINIYCVGTWYKCLQTLLSLVSQPWWERIWIVQEAFLSPKAIVNIGRFQIFLSSFFAATKNYFVHCEGCCKDWTWLWHGIEQIFLPLLNKMQIVMDLGRVIDEGAAGELAPVSLAFLSQQRKATDPRDHFYAITGLMKNPFDQSPLGPVPDYRLDPGHLFRDQTLKLMQQSGSIDLLDRAIGVDAPNPLGLPSWACDWSHYKGLGWRSSLYNASKGYKHEFRYTKAESTFIIAGVLIDVVSKLGNLVDPDDAEDIAVKVEQWQHLAVKDPASKVQQWLHLTGKDQGFDVRTVLRASLLDMIMPREGQHRRLTPHDMTLLEEWWQHWIRVMKRRPGPTESPDIWKTHNCFSYQMKRDRVYATRGGRFGVGPRTLCVGDQLFVVQGAQVPLVLRTLDGNGSTEPSTSPRSCRDYAYVGRTYLHGCMDGEAVTSKTAWQTLRLH